MSKTPISTLAEYAAKTNQGLPMYTLVAETNGTHEASFTYKVDYCKRSALGTASNKKEAKHIAAKNILRILETSTYDDSQPTNNDASQRSKICQINSYYQPGSNDIEHSNVFVNSVGKLSEHCVHRKLLSPQYELRNSSGPSHLMEFTIICSVGKLTAQATARTKKQAKHDAAQNMIQILMKTTKESTFDNTINICKEEVNRKLHHVNILDLQIEQPKMPIVKSSELAKELFPKLRQINSIKVVKNVEISEYHRALRECLEPSRRETLRRELRTTTGSSKQEILQRITKLMDIEVEMTVLVNTVNGCAVSLKLDSTPVLMDIGVGPILSEAKEKAASNLLCTIDTLLL